MISNQNCINKKVYPGIDIMKLVCAILIVYMHTYCYDLGNLGNWIKQVLSSVGVPFFFIASGFFYVKGLQKAVDPWEYFKKYFFRVLKMYIVWTILSLPVAWYNIIMVHGDYSLLKKIVYLIRCILFSGSVGIYWYILSLLYLSVVLYVVYVKGWDKTLYLVSIVLFIIGVIYSSGLIEGTYLFHFIHAIFGSERNFLNVGLLYMSIGYYFAKHRQTYDAKGLLFLTIVTIILKTVEIVFCNIEFVQLFFAIVLFLLSLNISVRGIEKYAVSIRKLSTAIYLIHFLFILVFDFKLQKGTLLDFAMTLIFSIAAYFLVVKIVPDKWLAILLGK